MNYKCSRDNIVRIPHPTKNEDEHRWARIISFLWARNVSLTDVSFYIKHSGRERVCSINIHFLGIFSLSCELWTIVTFPCRVIYLKERGESRLYTFLLLLLCAQFFSVTTDIHTSQLCDWEHLTLCTSHTEVKVSYKCIHHDIYWTDGKEINISNINHMDTDRTK